MSKILIATDKPFSEAALTQIKSHISQAQCSCNLLEGYTTKAELLEAVIDADALIVRSDIVDEEVLQAAKQLKIIVRAGAGYDTIDLPSATKRGIVVMNTPGQNANAVAELVFGMMVFYARGGFSGKAGTELRGKTIGIHAFGYIGKLVAKIAQGFGMIVYAYDPYVSHSVIEAEGVISLGTVEELYSTCQYISLHIPATEKTKRSINKALLSHMPQNAVLVNTARKEVINEEELLSLMSERADFSYISDIAPSLKDDFEKQFPSRVFFTPKKLGAQTEEANTNAGVAAAKQIIKFFANGDTTFQVNK